MECLETGIVVWLWPLWVMKLGGFYLVVALEDGRERVKEKSDYKF